MDINQPEHPSLRPSPLCCSVNGRWDGISYSVLSMDDRYGLMYRQLQVLFRCQTTQTQHECLAGGKSVPRSINMHIDDHRGTNNVRRFISFGSLCGRQRERGQREIVHEFDKNSN